jgi:hypothetical protein
MLRRLQNLKQLKMSVKEYMEEFYRLSIRSGKNEERLESIVRYVNGLSYAIQDEFHVLNFHSMVEAYQATLRIDQPTGRRLDADRGRGRSARGRSIVNRFLSTC